MSKVETDSNSGEYQPGGEDGILNNLLGITAKRDIDLAETELLEALHCDVLLNLPDSLSFDTIGSWHRCWLGNLYEWGGEWRTVNISKAGFQFAAASQLKRLGTKFEDEYLSLYSELPTLSEEQVIQYLAESHVEFILIHPFREGNGRISRLLTNVLVMKAGYDPIDFQLWCDHKDFYFKAIQAGLYQDYSHMAMLVQDSLANYSD